MLYKRMKIFLDEMNKELKRLEQQNQETLEVMLDISEQEYVSSSDEENEAGLR